MTSDRFVLLGLARPRTSWFAEVSRWATSAIVPAEFVKCVSVEELRARLASGRAWSAVLLDAGLPSVDRDLLAAARDAGCTPIVVDVEAGRRWVELGAAAVLPVGFDRRALLEVLEAVASTIERAVGVPHGDDAADAAPRGEPLVVAVCGPGGTGSSITAAALAQGLAADGTDVVLADLARHAEQAVLHDVRDVVPGVQELVEAHRSGVPSAEDVRALTFSIVERRYSLLLGLRRSRYWPTLRPRAFDASFVSLCNAFDAVVADITADFEGERDGGSVDVEERNIAARAAVGSADAVLVVGRAGVKGIHALVRVVTEIAAADVPAERIVPVVTCAPRSPRARAEISAAVVELSTPAAGAALPTTLFLPVRPVDAAVRDGASMPAPLPGRLAAAVMALRSRTGPRARAGLEPVPVAPGTIGALGEDV